MLGLVLAQVRYAGVSNESPYGIMRFVSVAQKLGLPKIVSIQNSYSLLVRPLAPLVCSAPISYSCTCLNYTWSLWGILTVRLTELSDKR